MFRNLFLTLAALGASAFAADTSAYIVAVDPNSGNAQFGKLNLNDGSFFLIRNYALTFDGLHRTSKGLVAVDANGFLFRVEAETGYLTFVGASGVEPGGPFDQPFNAVGGTADGRLFGIDSHSNLWQINTDTGKATMVGNLGL